MLALRLAQVLGLGLGLGLEGSDERGERGEDVGFRAGLTSGEDNLTERIFAVMISSWSHMDSVNQLGCTHYSRGYRSIGFAQITIWRR